MIVVNQTKVFQAALSYLASQGSNADPRLCRSIGIRPDQIHSLESLDGEALAKLAARCDGCIRVELDPELLDEVLNAVA